MKHLIAAVFAAIFLTGCCNIEYAGKEATPLKSEKDVVLYFSDKQYPRGATAEVLGDVKASAGTNWTAQQVQAKLRVFAAEKGANGLLIEKIERIPAGEARPDQIKNLPAKSWTVSDNSNSAAQYFRDDMINYSKKPEVQEEIYRIVIYGKLLKVSQKMQEKNAK